MTKVSVVIPVAPHHKEVAQTAAASVKRQTVPTELVVIEDVQQMGTGWARNRGLEQVQTPYVVFLDADDELASTFCEKTMGVIKPETYVFTDWHAGDRLVKAASQPWCNLLRVWHSELEGEPIRLRQSDTWHPITALLPTKIAATVGGFDESLPGAEDTAFYLEILEIGMCGVHVPEALFRYAPYGRRGRNFAASAEYGAIMQSLKERFGGMNMGCCDQSNHKNVKAAGAQREGYVLARAIFGGKRRVRGVATGVIYGPCGNGHPVWIDPRDLAMMSRMFQPMEPGETFGPMGLKELAQHTGKPSIPRRPPLQHVSRAERASVTPDFDVVIELAAKALEEE